MTERNAVLNQSPNLTVSCPQPNFAETVGDGGSGNAAGEAYSLALGESNSWVTSNYGSIRTNAGAGGFGGGGGGIDVVGDGGTNTAVSTGRSRGGAMALGFGNFEGLVFGGNRNQAVVEGKGDKHQQRNENSNKNKGKNQDDEDETEEEDLGPSGVMDYAAAGGSAAGYGESVGAGQGIDVGIGVTEAVSVGESGGYAISNSIVDAGNEGAQGGARGEGFGSSGGACIQSCQFSSLSRLCASGFSQFILLLSILYRIWWDYRRRRLVFFGRRRRRIRRRWYVDQLNERSSLTTQIASYLHFSSPGLVPNLIDSQVSELSASLPS